MNLRAVMLPAFLCAGILSGQAPQAPAPAGSSSNAGASIGATSSAVTGASGSAPGILQTPANQNSGNGAHRGSRAGVHNSVPAHPSHSKRGGGNTSGLPPAADADSRIVITGFPAANPKGTADRPLLPIVGVSNALGIPSGTLIRVRLRSTVDSGHAHNGDMLDGTLADPIGSLPVGTPVRLTVVQSAPAGRIASYGELSIQVVSIADRRILSDTVTAIGKAGAKELPDAAPARGTEAVFTPDQTIELPTA